ncbi:MAG: hypothetical protein AAGJ35_11990 [Myxococcota bacterium]
MKEIWNHRHARLLQLTAVTMKGPPKARDSVDGRSGLGGSGAANSSCFSEFKDSHLSGSLGGGDSAQQTSDGSRFRHGDGEVFGELREHELRERMYTGFLLAYCD